MTDSNEIYDFYQNNEVKKLLTPYHNPHFINHQIKIPFRMGIIGSSSAGKTQLLLNIIHKMDDTFGHIHVVYKSSEPLYEFLEKKIGADNITFYSNLHDLPPPNDFPHKDKQQLVVFDDQVNEKNQELIKELFIRGRKIGCGLSLVYLSQSFFKIPKLIRQQFNYLILLKLSSNRDLNLILSDFSLGVSKKKLEQIYKDATKTKFHFLKVSIDEPDENKKFSHNFTGFFKVDEVEKGEGLQIDYAKKLVYGRNGFSPSVQKIVEQFGNEIIEGVVVVRNPLMNMINVAYNTIASVPYDKLFHLALYLKTRKGILCLEKSHSLDITVNKSKPSNSQEMDIQFPKITLNTLLENTERYMGSNKFHSYQASTNNCQDFVMAVLKSNGVSNPTYDSFIKQTTQQLFKERPILRRITNTITDLGNRANIISQGGRIINNKYLL